MKRSNTQAKVIDDPKGKVEMLTVQSFLFSFLQQPNKALNFQEYLITVGERLVCMTQVCNRFNFDAISFLLTSIPTKQVKKKLPFMQVYNFHKESERTRENKEGRK